MVIVSYTSSSNRKCPLDQFQPLEKITSLFFGARQDK